MKAWIVGIEEEWCTLIHEDTRGRAKVKIARWYGLGEPFTAYFARRLPGLDDKQITYQNAKAAGFEYMDDWDGDLLPEEEFINDCECEICNLCR